MSTRLERATTFIWNNARLLERYRFAYHFLGGERQPVIAALRPYQNPDGGFGNALEPDKRTPHSQPVDAHEALHILDETGALTDPALHSSLHQELLLPLCDFLLSITTPEGGIPFSLPSANDYPHAPWWSIAPNPPANINPTAGIAGLLLKAGVAHPWVERAVEFCWQSIENHLSTEFHELLPSITFLENAPDKPRAKVQLDRIAQVVQQPGMVEMDPQAAGYVKMPLDWAPTSGSFLAACFQPADIQRHLHALAARQLADGGWPITWDPISPAVECEYRSIVTINALLTLRAYGFEA